MPPRRRDARVWGVRAQRRGWGVASGRSPSSARHVEERGERAKSPVAACSWRCAGVVDSDIIALEYIPVNLGPRQDSSRASVQRLAWRERLYKTFTTYASSMPAIADISSSCCLNSHRYPCLTCCCTAPSTPYHHHARDFFDRLRRRIFVKVVSCSAKVRAQYHFLQRHILPLLFDEAARNARQGSLSFNK